MTPELWQRLKPLFHDAMERAPGERAAFINAACGADAELKRDLLGLVESAQQATIAVVPPASTSKISLAPASSGRFHAGELILGRFRIVRPIGAGGMGEVYEAEDLQLGRVALKTIRAGVATSPQAFERFRREVQLARKVSGPEVCRIHELFLMPAGPRRAAMAFLTMEFLDGVTLLEKLSTDGPMPAKAALRVALDICRGLQLVHAQGVIHRDLKSSNIMLCGQGGAMRAVLTDFGLARNYTSGDGDGGGADDAPGHEAAADETLSGTVVGTPAYMAPEQFEAKPVSPATDIYALGIVLYELVTGLHPYAAPTPMAAAIRRAQRPPPASSVGQSVPRKWDRVIQRCLQYEPSDRYQSAGQVADELRASAILPGKLRQDNPWLFRAGCAALLAALAWGAFSWWQIRQYYHPGPRALAWYQEGLSSLHEGNCVKATRLLQAAIGEDRHFALAHARLAEALYDLDFQGSAQQELLVALPGRVHLAPMDQLYLEAIHATVTGDEAGAVHDYAEILDELPAPDKSSGYVDLGIACERSGDISGALANYSRAEKEDSRNPAAFMRIGVLESRMHHGSEENAAFQKAHDIFNAEVNAEGLAELDYERGYAINVSGDAKGAETLLNQALSEAQAIQSVQLQIRALTQLSSAEYNSYNDAGSVEHANQAIKLARDNQLESWAANGLVRLAAEQLVQSQNKEAEQSLQEAMQILKQSPQPRVEALANSTLASLMSQEGRADEIAVPAQAALDYYRQHGFSEGALAAGNLLVRAKSESGQYKQALDDGNVLLELARQSDLPERESQAEETVGGTYEALERYPQALTHFEAALHLAPSDNLRDFQALHCAVADMELGRFNEAEAMFKVADGNPKLHNNVQGHRIDSLLAQAQYVQAMERARAALAAAPDMEARVKRGLRLGMAVAEAHSGMKDRALADLAAYTAEEPHTNRANDVADNQLAVAEIYLWVGMNREALENATAALTYFDNSGLRSSALRSAYVAAAAAKALKDEVSLASFNKKVLDIRAALQQDWGSDSFHTYISSPDWHVLIVRATP